LEIDKFFYIRAPSIRLWRLRGFGWPLSSFLPAQGWSELHHYSILLVPGCIENYVLIRPTLTLSDYFTCLKHNEVIRQGAPPFGDPTLMGKIVKDMISRKKRQIFDHENLFSHALKFCKIYYCIYMYTYIYKTHLKNHSNSNIKYSTYIIHNIQCLHWNFPMKTHDITTVICIYFNVMPSSHWCFFQWFSLESRFENRTVHTINNGFHFGFHICCCLLIVEKLNRHGKNKIILSTRI